MKLILRKLGGGDVPPCLVRLTVAVLLWSATVGLRAAERLHVVKRGDTLSGVAAAHGVSLPALAERNGLKPTAWLLAGQKLVLPSSGSSARPPKPALPAPVAKHIASASVKSGRWKRIVLHHSGTSEGTIKGMNEYHLKVRRMENGLAYHFVIGNGRGLRDGEIYVGNRWKRQIHGGHLASEAQNETSLGICLVGNFDLQPPTSQQMKSLTALVQALQQRCRLSDQAVMTHQQVNVLHTRCPGKAFPWKSFMDSLARLEP